MQSHLDACGMIVVVPQLNQIWGGPVLDQMTAIIVTAILSSVFTLIGFWLLFRFVLLKTLEKQGEELADDFEKQLTVSFEKAVDEALPEFRAELEAGFKEAGEELLPGFTKAMKDGFHEAGQELLPELRAEVHTGFKNAIVDVVSGGLVPGVAKKGTNIVSRFFGTRKDES